MSQKVNSKRLKKKQGMIICTGCAHKFNALASLSDTQHVNKAEKLDHDRTAVYSWQKQSTPQPIAWLMGSLLGLAMLAFQVHYFMGYRLAQNPHTRPWLQRLTNTFNDPLPTYRNLSEFTTVGSALQHTPDNTYHLQASFINHAEFSQALPQLQLTLRNLQGGVFAQRTFSPQEYLSPLRNERVIISESITQSKHKSALGMIEHPRLNQDTLLINPSSTLDIDLIIALPAHAFGGYEIALR